MNNLKITELKRRFLDGEITASEYEATLNALKTEIERKELNDTVDSPQKKDNSLGVITVFLSIIFLVFFIAIKFKPKNKTLNVVQSEPETISLPIQTEREKAIEDSIYNAEEAAFMKTKAGRIYKKHPEWSKRDCESLAENKIWVGMSIDMLKYKRGRPNSANPSNYGNGVTQWQWCWHDWTPSCFYDNDGDGLVDSYN